MSINYIISSHPGKIDSRKNQWISPYVLSLQLLELKYIFQMKKKQNIVNNIGQITIIKTKSKNNEFYKEYYDSDTLYDIEGVPLRFVDYKGKNTDHSYDQWLQGIEAFPNFDYFIFIEDDYCFSRDNINFDNELINLYIKKFSKDNYGYLCSLTLDNPFHHAAISNGIINKNTSNKISTEIYYDKDNNYNYLYSYPQLKFSEMMLKNNITISDTTEVYYTPFWDTTSQSIKNYSKINSINKSLLPIQDTFYQNLSINEVESILDKELFNKV